MADTDVQQALQIFRRYGADIGSHAEICKAVSPMTARLFSFRHEMNIDR